MKKRLSVVGSNGPKNIRPIRNFTKVPNSFIYEKGLTVYERVLLVYIFSFTVCYVGQSRMATDLGTSKKTIQRTIASLLKKNIIRKIPKQNWSVFYAVNPKAEWVFNP